MASYNQQNTSRFTKNLDYLIQEASKIQKKSPEMKGGSVYKQQQRIFERTRKYLQKLQESPTKVSGGQVKEYKPQSTTMKGGNPNVDIIIGEKLVEPVRKHLTRKATLSEEHHKTIRKILKDLFD